MYHMVARTRHGELLATDHVQAAALWTRVVGALPTLVAFYVMPNHVHVLASVDGRGALMNALGGYARWRAHRLGLASASLWERSPMAVRVEDGQKARRVERYIVLNGCRARLDRDPLEAAWSTHRDAVGLVVRPVRPPSRDVVAHHRYVSADSFVSPDGTSLPAATGHRWTSEEDAARLVAAVSSVTRTPASLLSMRCPGRTLLIQAARVHADWSASEIADRVGVATRTVRSVEPVMDAAVALVARVHGDPRFTALEGPVWSARVLRSARRS